jgi:hypothetical protein
MGYDSRKLSLYGTTGVLVAALIIAGVVFSGLRLPTFVLNTGTLVVKLTDAPVELKHLNVTIANLSAQRIEDGNETWENLSFVDGVPEVYVDILALQNITRDLSITEISPGNYTKLRMTITTANATYVNGETVDLKVPPGRIDVKVHFEIKAGETTKLLIDMQADWVAISHSQNLRPVLKATVLSGE